MKEYLNWFFGAFEYPEEAAETMLAAYDALYAKPDTAARFDEILGRYDAGIPCDIGKMIEDVGKLLEEAQVNEYTGKLLMHICMSKRLREYYRQEGVDEKNYSGPYPDLVSNIIYDYYQWLCLWFYERQDL